MYNLMVYYMSMACDKRLREGSGKRPGEEWKEATRGNLIGLERGQFC